MVITMRKIPLPTPRQEEWADLELGVIIHHCMETYHPDIPISQWKCSPDRMPAESFAPTDENTDQWLEAASKLGAKYAVFVANHVTGFSMWPLRGKNKPEYTPHIDTGDYVIVVNAEKVKVTGKKLQQKIYYNHSDYVGGMRETTLAEMMAKKPEKVIELAVKGMLPKGPMGRSMIKKLHVYAGPEHANQAQKPEVLTF